MMHTDALVSLPWLNVCNGNWQNFGKVVNSAISAVTDAAALSAIKILNALHIAEPNNVGGRFSGYINTGKVTGFNIIGSLYYPEWHTLNPFNQLFTNIAAFKKKLKRKIMVLETAYP